MYVYFIVAFKSPRKVKIGKSKNPIERLKELQTGCPEKLKLEGVIKCRSESHALQMEKAAHALFKEKHYRGEWFKCTDYILCRIWELTGIQKVN